MLLYSQQPTLLTKNGGSGEIRTHGPFRADSFQDCCNKPDSATLPFLVPPRELESRTFRLSSECSNQLSYGGKYWQGI